MVAQDPQYFLNHVKGQSPKLLWIGCSDSRVPPTDVTGFRSGEIFVARNVANIVSPSDVNLLSVLEYAVGVLKIPEIVVCGHYHCGGVLHAMNQPLSGTVDKWLNPVKDTYLENEKELQGLTGVAREKRLVELNVIAQVYNVAKTSIVQESWKANGTLLSKPGAPQVPNISGWVYDLETGLLKDLNVDLTQLPKIFRMSEE